MPYVSVTDRASHYEEPGNVRVLFYINRWQRKSATIHVSSIQFYLYRAFSNKNCL